jgi:hypothetical protein
MTKIKDISAEEVHREVIRFILSMIDGSGQV